MPPPIMTPRATQIKAELLNDARQLITGGAIIHSRQIEALAGAVARHLAAIEEVIDQRLAGGK